MVELSKDTLLYHFPYTPRQGNQVKENKTIFDVIRQIELILWQELSTGNSDRSADIELKLIDYQSDIAQRKKEFQDMREDLSEEMQQRQKEYQERKKEILEKHVPDHMLQQGRDNYPWSVAEKPKEFANEYKAMRDEFEELLEEVKEVEEAFQKKMESASTIKLHNTEAFSREEIGQLNGKLIKAVRPLLEDVETIEAEVVEG